MKRFILINGTLAAKDGREMNELRRLVPEWELLIDPEPRVVEDRIGDIGIVFGQLGAELIERAVALEWIQLEGAGVERLASSLRRRDVTVTNASGVHAVPITEHLLAMMLAFARGIHRCVRRQRDHCWDRQSEHQVFELSGSRVLLIGTGAIGAHFAGAASALGMSVVGVRRRPENGGASMERVIGPEDLLSALPDADFVVLTVPRTPHTEGMIGRREIDAMKDGAFILNIGRGATIDEAALVAGLTSGKLGGAGLDVFEQEPLPPDSPLWDMENVIVTPHSSGITPRYSERLWRIFLDNVGRWKRQDSMRNVVDLESGY